MSLPPHVQWHYDHHPVAGSEEEKNSERIRKTRRLGIKKLLKRSFF